jgi:ABC-type branched-subunit amino acid transport system permease subunit
MTTETVHPHVVHPHAKVRRATKSSWVGLGVIVVLVLAAPAAPYVLDKGTQGSLVTLFSLIVMATMWNLLAGYGGMLSVGQQAYIGIGAYALVYIADTIGIDPFMAVPLAVVVAGLISYPISFLAFRLSGGYFAIGTWVIAVVIMEIVQQVPAFGGGIGETFTAFSDLGPPWLSPTSSCGHDSAWASRRSATTPWPPVPLAYASLAPSASSSSWQPWAVALPEP